MLVFAELMSWQMVQSSDPAAAWVPQAWRPTASLNWEVVVPPLMAWQSEHWEVEAIAPVRQLGVIWPPWQLVLEQVREEGLNPAVPPL